MLSAVKDTTFSSNFYLNYNGNLTVYKHPIVMGILNATPDSFYAKSRQLNVGKALEEVAKMIQEGAEIIDIGGYSSRPGAADISIKEEIGRVVPLISEIKAQFPHQIISIDTFRTEVAEKAIDVGANVINDISGGYNNPSIYQLASNARAPYIMMHMVGTPQSMQTNINYENLLRDILYFFSKQIDVAKSIGLNDIIIDPGIGFSKTIDQNFEVIKKLKEFSILRQPILAGVSRKSLIYKTLKIKPEFALNGTTVLNTACLLNGARILRVHDVTAAREAIELTSYIVQ
ncbi:MAG: dihydropteroate synthase [Crocinitomicaceae bacterium]